MNERLIRESAESKWISVKDRLPKKKGRYLCNIAMTRKDMQTILQFALNLEEVDEYDFQGRKRKGFYEMNNDGDYFEVKDVTHWMPLPEPPKMG